MPCADDYQGMQLRNVGKALSALRRGGLGPGMPAFDEVYKLRGKIMAQLGFKAPKPISMLLKLAGLSPGEIKVFLDTETGWFTEAREKPGAPPVYHRVSDDVAMALLKGELTKEMEAELMKPDEYIGE